MSSMRHPCSRRSARALARSLASTIALLAFGAAPAAQALTSASSKPRTTPTFPVPASERAQPGAAGGAPAPATTTPAATTPAATSPGATTPLPGTATTGTATIPAAKSLQPSSASAPAQGRPRRAGKLSDAAIAIAAVAALLALACAAWGIARLQAYEPHWTLSLRHAMAEAGFRASATWAEFSDWARAGH